MNHVSTPWRVTKDGTSLYPINIRDANGRLVTTFHSFDTHLQANAEHIVKCVNLHDELVNVLQDLDAFNLLDETLTECDSELVEAKRRAKTLLQQLQ